MNVKDIFIDKNLQQQFNQQGFVTLQLLDENAIEKLNLIFEAFKEKHPIVKGQGYNISSYSSDLEYKKTINSSISKIVQSFLQNHFIDYHLIGSAFAYKVPDKNGFLSPHQEWTMVDEEQHVSITCWIPLQDINKKNGMLYVLPGSQFSNNKTIRGIGIEPFFKNNINDVMRYSIGVPVKAGEAIFLNQSLIHYSTPNYSKDIRKAIITTIKSIEAKDTFLFYKNNENNKLEKYKVSEDFALEYDDLFSSINQKPVGKFVEDFDIVDSDLDVKKNSLLIKNMAENAGFNKTTNGILKNKIFHKLQYLRSIFKI